MQRLSDCLVKKMLERLTVRNIALIEESCVDLDRGFNVVTGETGSGKTIWLESIKLICGARMSKDFIRSGCQSASVEAVFLSKATSVCQSMESAGVPINPTGRITLYREINTSGQSKCRVNNISVSVQTLRDITSGLIDIHGQFDNQSLFVSSRHLDLLDDFGFDTISQHKAEYLNIFTECLGIKDKLKSLRGSDQERQKVRDLLVYQIEELETANLSQQEFDRLSSLKKKLLYAEKIQTHSSNAIAQLVSSYGDQDSVITRLQEAGRELSKAAALDNTFAAISDRLLAAGIDLKDISDELISLVDNLEFDSADIENVETRLGIYDKLTRKYGGSLDSAIEHLRQSKAELADLDNTRQLAAKYTCDLANARERLKAQALMLSHDRKQVAKVMEEKITSQLKDLEMNNVTFKVVFEDYDPDTAKLGRNGFDVVEFRISVNPGEPLKPLAKIGSGGEISRIMLAIKTIISEIDNIETVVFDEIDTGISGVAAQQVGLKLKHISKDHQVICVTHHGIIAAMSDNHYCIEKTVSNGRTYSKIDKLDYESKVREISRIIGGSNITESAIAHSRELIKKFTE